MYNSTYYGKAMEVMDEISHKQGIIHSLMYFWSETILYTSLQGALNFIKPM